jgi:hypothetical protein
MARRKIKLYKDKRGRYIRRKRKKIYFHNILHKNTFLGTAFAYI